ncbi:MAG: hypothetical protein U1A28_04935, partial [Patescibacteria group bacterium]|nr:hypothetical protein [Patescibacteria group bacterium]
LRPHSILILSLSAIFLFVGGFFALQGVSRWWGSTAKKNTPSVRVVELRDDGFYPPTISISPGDTIHFTTTRTEPFWPASNLHPTHALYPEFDPKKPVSPTASWTFTFSKPGSWEYHDHLAPLYRGVITVGNEQEKQGCDGGENTLCSQEEIGAALTAGGVSAAFDVVASLYTRQSFSGDCHGYAHEIGEAAYFLYEGGKDMRLSPKTSYCGYGFYHGFM